MAQRTNKQQLGEFVEQQSIAYLTKQGMQLIDKNARFREGELDLILLDQKTLVFCEVRYRNNERYGGALASIDANKCQRIALAAEQWRRQNTRYQLHECRFDAIGVTGDTNNLKIDWRKHAFRLEDLR